MTHTHTDGLEHGDCGLCLTAHLTVPLALMVTLAAVGLSFRRLAVAQASGGVRRRLVEHALFTRPPPANCFCA